MIDIQRLNEADISKPVEILDRVWWVGTYMPDDIFQCNAYLIENGDRSVLIDPGGLLTFKHVLKKVQKVVPFSDIRYFICHHQDPDITGSLKKIDAMSGRHKDAEVVTHWRASQLIKHYDLKMPFSDIDALGWSLDLNGRVLQFVFTPYLHFPGAFCTFDVESGTLFSSDIFGGMTNNWTLAARDESYFEDIRPFHEHYMPSRDILQHGLTKIEGYPVKQIAPQHGSIITGDLVGFMTKKLKDIDCGIYTLAEEKTDIRRLSLLNRNLQDITKAMIVYRDFRDIANALLEIFRRILPVASIEFYASTSGGDVVFLAQETRYNGVTTEAPEYCKDLLGIDREYWKSRNKTCYRKVPIPVSAVSYRGGVTEHSILIPIFSTEQGASIGVAVLRLSHDLVIPSDIEQMVEQMSETLGVAVEREILYRMLDQERSKLYSQSIRDQLTGLYNRQHMEEAVSKLMSINDRNPEYGISVAMMDIDHFKSINDEYGHGAGDDVLKVVGSVISCGLRTSDVPVRYGGEEFAIFLTGGSIEDCTMVTERIRQNISKIEFDGVLKGHKITVSAGIAQRRCGETMRDMISRADKALYKAKRAGRDRVLIAGD